MHACNAFQRELAGRVFILFFIISNLSNAHESESQYCVNHSRAEEYV